MGDAKYTTAQQVPMLYIAERVKVGEDKEVVIEGELYLPEGIKTRNKETIKEVVGEGVEVEVHLQGVKHKVKIKYKNGPLEEIVCKPEKDEGLEDVTIDIWFYLRTYLSEEVVDFEDIIAEIQILEYDIEKMRRKYRCQSVTIKLEEDIEIQGIIFKKGSEVQGQIPVQKSFCQSII